MYSDITINPYPIYNPQSICTAKMVANYTEEEIKKAHEILFNEGVKMRYQVAGKDYVDAALKKRNDPFAGAMQDV